MTVTVHRRLNLNNSIKYLLHHKAMKDLTGGSESDFAERRHAVPVLHVRGSHYDIGYDVGRIFASLIKNFIAHCERLTHFVEEYETPTGKKVYDKTLEKMNERFPYYVREIKGISDGAMVPFHLLFLLQMDDIIETVNGNEIDNNTSGCSSIGIRAKDQILGHTEDAFEDTLNHFYILSAHVIPTAEDIAAGAREEKFASLCYAGHLPGYTMGFNQHGLIFSINTLSPNDLAPGKTPRTFITRALLSATDFEDAERIIRDEGLGAANGCSLNILFDKASGTTMYNVEMAPNLNKKESLLDIFQYKERNTFLVHCNKYQRLDVKEFGGPIVDSSNQRLETFSKYNAPQSKKDVIKMLSDRSGKPYHVFQNVKGELIRTIAVGIFDLDERTWSLYTDIPSKTEAIAVLPIFNNNAK